ncbi:magnesium protoporphyrin IX methyltransferase [Sphingomicrobium sediminis]|uniref:Magnesium protoporphyrin IX methyltransferase n=1 Tax=Sphingomicrobium sediminis TaxID=2950949 RepID=A0A9X2EFB6_9SPHN|nr:magnesium protoporphyrin IX methyltransferase [Sphingomicrobium sediminis]MCM8556507.1 magnesium protoporphyrin IX methyltransferase [Sphingomicrobium sediminis]
MAARAPTSYDQRREALAGYFDGTARKAWVDLTSDAKVSGIRATVRAGREEMRATLLSWLPERMSGLRLLDAGCGTGALSIAAASRGAEVTAIDVAKGLVAVAEERAPGTFEGGRIDWVAGDMLDPTFGDYDHVVAMDSLIHYDEDDLVAALDQFGQRTRRSILFTFAPWSPLLSLMHKAGKLFPRSDRSPAIVPIAEKRLRERLAAMAEWRIAQTHRVSSGFYTSQAMELVRR